MATFVFIGLSGKRYTYSIVPANEAMHLPLQAGNYLFASGDAVTPIPVFINQAASIRKSFLDLNFWPIAQRVHYATLLYLHVDLEQNLAAREAEQMDLIAAYSPPMNSTGA